MRRASFAVLGAAAAAAVSVWVGIGVAATPSSGTVSTGQDAVWQGGPFTVPNPAACLGSADPTCDHFFLEVDAPAGSNVLVAIDGAADADDYDLFVYHPDGTLAAQKATGGGNESVVFEHGTAHGTGPYEVRVQPFLVSPGSTYSGAAALTGAAVDGEPRECLAPVPPALGLDLGQPITLSVVTLLDGITAARGAEVMAKAAEAYAPLNVVVESQFQTVSFTGDEAEGLIQQAKDLFGGERPQGADLVYVLTSKNIQSGGNASVAGLADCIGGVRFPERAFAVGENISENDPLGPFVTTVNGTAVVAAHELGHLMGAHHHYANCVEGVAADELLANQLTPCTLMFNAVDTASLKFSIVNTPVVRGHAVDYASP
jgi:hypothetical protein